MKSCYAYGIVLTLTLVNCCPLLAQTYSRQKEGKLVKFQYDGETITFGRYKSVSKGRQEMPVDFDSQKFTFAKWLSSEGEIAEVREASGKRIATVYLSGPNEGNIVTADGKTLLKKAKDDFNASYYAGDVETFSISVRPKSDEVTVNMLSGDAMPPGLTLALLNESQKHFRNRVSPWPFIGVAVMLAVARAVLAGSGESGQ